MIKTKGIRHIGIFTKNPKELVIFYEKILNFKVVYNHIETFKNMLNLNEPIDVNVIKMSSENGSQIEILYTNIKDERNDYVKKYFDYGIGYIALTVSGLKDIYDNLLKQGYESISEEIYKASDKINVLFCKDYDGNILELVEEI